MRELTGNDVSKMPRDFVKYTESTFVSGAVVKWIPAALVAIFTDVCAAFTELFWVVVMLWVIDFVVGILRAAHNPDVEFSWSKAYGSVLKLFIIALSVPAMHLIEHLVAESGVDLTYKLTSAVLIVIGVTEAGSVLDNMAYFWPQLDAMNAKVKDLLGRARENGKK